MQTGIKGVTTTETADVITPEYRRYALLILLLVFASSHVDRQILAILLEPIKHDSDTHRFHHSVLMAGRTLQADLARAREEVS